MTKQVAILGSSKLNTRDTLYIRTVRAARNLHDLGFTVHSNSTTGVGAAVYEGCNACSVVEEPKKYAGVIALPGGYGTLTYLTQAVLCKQKYQGYFPIILVGPMWRDIASSVSRMLHRNALIDTRDLGLWDYAQTPEAAAVKLIEMLM